MNSMLNELSASGSKSDKALKELAGKSFKDLMKEGKSLSDVLMMLEGYASFVPVLNYILLKPQI